MKLVWYISIFVIIFSILLYSPQRGSAGMFGNESQLLNPTRSTQNSLQLLISVNIAVFFMITILLVINS